MTTGLRIVIPGGSGHLGGILAQHFHEQGHRVTVLSRHVQTAPWRVVSWDGRDLGNWAGEMDGADVVINLAGRSVNCRYTEANRREIMDSRVLSTQVIGRAIAQASRPPQLWLNAGTATIYRHSFDQPMDETSGEIGGAEPDAPAAWRFSINVATRWEQTFYEACTPHTQKMVLRCAVVMSAHRAGAFSTLSHLVRAGFGGPAASGGQYVSWIHEADFVRAVDFLIGQPSWSGCVNVCSPNPLPNREFMRILQQAYGRHAALPAARWMLEIGAFFLRTETELVLKSRRVIPSRLLDAGFEFRFSQWNTAAGELAQRWRQHSNQLPSGLVQPQA